MSNGNSLFMPGFLQDSRANHRIIKGRDCMMRTIRLTSFILLVILLLASGIASAASDSMPKIVVCYYYNNPCGSCNEESKFYDEFNTLVNAAKEGISLEFHCYNIFRSSDLQKFFDECKRCKIPKSKQFTPMVIIGDTVLAGDDEITGKLAETFVTTKQYMMKQYEPKDGISSPVYFYVSPCEECAETKKFIDSLEDTYAVDYNGRQMKSQLVLQSYNVAEPQNLELVKKYFQHYNVPEAKQKVPIIFLRDGYLSGKDEIASGLVAAVKSGRCIGIQPPGGEASLQPFEWPGIFLTGLLNGFNPCSISMLLFLAMLLLARNANVLKLGLLFILGKFIAYLVLGTLLFSLLSSIDNSIIRLSESIVKYVLLVIVLIAAAINVSDFAAARNEKYNKIRLQLPVRLRKLNHNWLKSISGAQGRMLLILSLALGTAISVGEFLCTGQIYLATILYLLKRSPELNMQTLAAFLVYILGMMVPLAAITLAIHKGRKTFDISEMARRNMPTIKLINAAVFMGFAIIILALF
jgi:cytochrome c biogenesis protein CcdA